MDGRSETRAGGWSIVALSVLAAAAILAGSALAAGPSSSFTGTSSGGSTPSSSFSGSGTTGGSGEGEGSDDSGGFGQEGGGEGGFSVASPGIAAVTGMSVAAVRRLQADLARLGYFHHVVTGVYGFVTTAAVKQFQHAAGLKVDGIWGPHSASALKKRLSLR